MARWGLRQRLVILILGLSLLVGLVCVGSASWAAVDALHLQQKRRAIEQAEAFDRALERALDDLAFQVTQRAAQAPLSASTTMAPVPGADPAGNQIDELVLGRGGVIEARWSLAHAARGGVPAPELSRAGLQALLFARESQRGLALVGTRPVLFALTPLGDGEQRLLGLVVLDQLRAQALVPTGWSMVLNQQLAGGADKADDAPGNEQVVRDQGYRIDLRYAVLGGHLTIHLQADPGPVRRSLAGLLLTVSLAGGCATLLVSGLALGIIHRWTAPIQALAVACRRLDIELPRALDETSGLPEVREMASALNALMQRLAVSRRRLDEALRAQQRQVALQHRFVRRVLGEFQQPLEMVRRELDADAAPAEERHRVRRAVRDMTERLTLLQGLAEPGEGPSRCVETRLRIDDFLHEVADLLRPMAEARGCQVHCLGSGQACRFAHQVASRCLVNLAVNALRAPGCQRVDLEAYLSEEAIVFVVRDDAQGIPNDLREAIAEACRNGKVRPEVAGFGLGLPLAIGQAEDAKGRIELLVTSTSGTTFRLTLPLWL